MHCIALPQHFLVLFKKKPKTRCEKQKQKEEEEEEDSIGSS